ncbi:uncharacterized protein [Antedon mediterranea]|uniref:uncharacterized protein n=1 Tax=Antedon mediterranea TaxID=105859 RepID=UPI003AF69003
MDEVTTTVPNDDVTFSTDDVAPSRMSFELLSTGYQVAICLQVILLIIISMVGLLGNTLTIIAIFRTKSLRITTNYFLINLAIADILVCVIIEPFYIVSLIYRGWPMSTEFCKTIGALTCLSLAASVINLLAISVNRYYCIVKNKLYAMVFSSNRTIIYCLVIWAISFLSIVLPSAGVGDFGFNEHLMICGYPATHASYVYQIVSMVIMFVASTCVIVYCYCNIYKRMQDSSRRTQRITSTNSESNSNINCVEEKKSTFSRMKSHKSSNMTMLPKKRDLQVAKTLLIVLLTFVICWTPSVLLTVFDKYYKAPDLLRQITAILALTNSSVNPFIYAWRNRGFRLAYIRIIKCRHWLRPGEDEHDVSKMDSTTNKIQVKDVAIKFIKVSFHLLLFFIIAQQKGNIISQNTFEMSISPDNNTMSSLDNNMNGSDNVTNIEPQEGQVIAIVESIILIILCVVGFFGNLLTIVAIVRTNKLRITANYFLVNLALADMIVCVIVEPFYLLGLFYRKWPLSDMFCATISGISIITLSSSVLNLVAIAVNRYFCIVQNQRYATLYTTNRTIFYCVMIWVVSFTLIMPASFGFGEFGFNKHLLICGYKVSEESWLCQIVTMAIMFAFSMITFVFCYYKICKEAHMSSRRSRRRKSSTTSQVSLAGSVKTLNKLQKHLSINKLNPQTREIQVAKTSFIVLITFMICWTPIVLQVIFDKKYKIPNVFVQVFALLSLANSSVNPFIYAWRNRHFRNAYKRIITCRHFFGKAIEDVSHTRNNNSTIA